MAAGVLDIRARPHEELTTPLLESHDSQDKRQSYRPHHIHSPLAHRRSRTPPRIYTLLRQNLPRTVDGPHISARFGQRLLVGGRLGLVTQSSRRNIISTDVTGMLFLRLLLVRTGWPMFRRQSLLLSRTPSTHRREGAGRWRGLG